MQTSITVTLPADVSQALDEFIRQEGNSRDLVVSQAVDEHLILQRSRSLQDGEQAEADLEAAYAEMAADEPRETDALEWAEATVGDADGEAR